VIPIQYNSGLISVALITVSLDARLADEIADSVLKMSWAVHRADCEGYISAVKRPPFSQPVKSAPACIAVINFDEDVEQAVASAAYIQELFSGNAASKAALGQPATHESGISVAGAPASGIAAPPVVASPESPRRYVFDNPTATPSTGGKPAVEPDTASRSMVQIMTLANKDDAESMAAALKRHGYNVAVNHDPQDSLLHLEVGPFASKTDAEAMRQRLLSDGYNASVR